MAQASYIISGFEKPKKAKARSRINGGSLLVMAMFAYGVLPAALQNLFNTRAPVWVTVETETSPLASMAGSILQYALIGLVAILALKGLSRFRGGWWLVVFVLPWVIMTIATAYGEHKFSYTSLIYPLVGLVAGSLKDPTAALRTAGKLTSLLAAGSIALGVFLPKAGLFPISADNDKSVIGDKLLAGPLFHPNTLGEALALGLPLVSLIKSKFWRLTSYALVLFALVWSGSRTAMIAAGVCIVAAACWSLIRKYQKGSMFSPLVLMGIYSGIVFIGPYIVSTGLGDVASYSGRGQIWQGSLDLWSAKPLIGYGVHIYTNLATIGNDVGQGAFHGHNMFVTFLITSGVLGAAALAIVYFAILRRSWVLGRAAIIGPAVWSVAFIVDGWMEVPSDLFTPGTLSWIVWLPLAVTLSGSLKRPNEAEQATQSPDKTKTAPLLPLVHSPR